MNKYKLTTAIASAALLVSALAPAAFANTNVHVSGNGALSNTSVKVKNVSGTTVSQTNVSNITTVVNSSANTGNNSSSFNTGGGSAIVTGNATSDVNVTTGGSSNTANVTSSCGCGGNTTVRVSGNGALSQNTVKVKNTSLVTVLQQNVTEILNVVTGKAKTGNNSSNFNTGGDSGVGTGDASSNVTVTTNGSSNTLNQ